MLVIAHRGASGIAPENTLAAFELALEQESDIIELDIQSTKDDVLVICHDPKINRTSNGKGYVHDHTFNDIRTYDFGSWFSDEFKGERIPSLKEALQLFQDTDIMINIEIKNGPIFYEGIEEKMLELLKQYQILDRVIVSSFDHRCLQKLRKLHQDIKLGMILPLNMVHVFQYIDQSGIEPYSLHPKSYYLTKELIQGAHNRDMKVFPYTVDNLNEGLKLKQLGIDGICTNYPDRFKIRQ